jgi:hypothetical protein
MLGGMIPEQGEAPAAPPPPPHKVMHSAEAAATVDLAQEEIDRLLTF